MRRGGGFDSTSKSRVVASLRLSTIVPIVIVLTFANVSILWLLNTKPVAPPVDVCGAVSLSTDLSGVPRLHDVYSITQPRKGPKYLLVFDIWYHEQTTQFKVVIRSMAKLAAMTNRILVLPYVAKSHIWGPSTRLRDDFKDRNLYPFNYYFDLVDPEKYVPYGIIQMDEYLARTGANREVVALHSACYGNGCGSNFNVIQCSADGYGAEKNAVELTKGYFKLNRTICMQIQDWNPTPVVNLMNGDLADKDIVWTHYHKFMMKWDDLPPILRLSTFLEEEGKRYKATELKGSYLAIHWRFEKSLIENVPQILPALLRTIDHNMATRKYESIFLATEYATGGSDSWSSNEREQKRPYYQKLVDHLRNTKGYTVMEGYKAPEVKDEGAVAILDQYLCIHATLFVPVDYASSFTRDIVERRDKAGEPSEKAVYQNYEWPIREEGKKSLEKAYPDQQ